MLDTTPEAQVSHLLDTLGEALEAGDIDTAVDQFQDECYWRDLVSFTWNIKTLEGKDSVRAMLEQQLTAVKPTQWTVDTNETVTDDGGIVTGWFNFETEVARGDGHVRLKDGKMLDPAHHDGRAQGPRGTARLERRARRRITVPASTVRPGRKSARRKRARSATRPSPTA